MICRCGCGKPVLAKGFASACYARWCRAGRPASGPPPPTPRSELAAYATAAKREANAERAAEYVRLRRLGFTVAQAASDVGIGEEWARRRYEPCVRERRRPA